MCPAKSGELYFVAKWDGSGGHWFSRTNEEHIRKKTEAHRINAQRIMRESRAPD
jgi:cell division protein YceG involved in septum cleavage